MKRDREGTLARTIGLVTHLLPRRLQRVPDAWRERLLIRQLAGRLRGCERWTPAHAAQFQLQALQEIVALAAHYVPGYTQKYANAGIGSVKLEALTGVERFPFLTRDELQSPRHKFRATNIRDSELEWVAFQDTPGGFYREKDSAKVLKSAVTAWSAGRSFYERPEQSCLAVACSSGAHHFLPSQGIVELIDSAGRTVHKEGESGEVVVTGFSNRATPFVRYRTGERAAWSHSPCPRCHWAFQTLTGLQSNEKLISRNAA